MSINESSVGAEVTVLTEASESFLGHGLALDLKKLQRDISRHTKAAIETLVRLMEDPKGDPKVQLSAAKALLESQIEVAAKISQDQIQRLVGHIKLNRGVQSSTQLVEDDSKPVVNFTEIRAV